MVSFPIGYFGNFLQSFRKSPNLIILYSLFFIVWLLPDIHFIIMKCDIKSKIVTIKISLILSSNVY